MINLYTANSEFEGGRGLKEVIISADGDSIVYLVPDAVASDLRKYCIYFCDKWMKTSRHAEKYKDLPYFNF